MRYIHKVAVAAFIIFSFAFAVSGQETEETVVDEVVAQINDSVVTLSQVKREKARAIEILMSEQGGNKSREEAEKSINEQEGQLIANLITEEMMRQKGVELGLEKSIEDQMNQHLLGLVKESNLKSINELFAYMRSQDVDPELWKLSYRKEAMKQQVLFQAVDSVVYWETSDQELKEYFKANQDKFLQKETVTLSEIFLPFAGKNEAEVEALAKGIRERARNGEDFEKLAVEFSERPNVAETKGLVGEFIVDKLNDDIKAAIKGLTTGAIAEPIKWDIGMEIIRIDKHIPASTESNFDESAVRRAIMEEKAPKARKEFIKKLRDDAYVKIRENYRGLVMPFLQDTPGDETASSKS